MSFALGSVATRRCSPGAPPGLLWAGVCPLVRSATFFPRVEEGCPVGRRISPKNRGRGVANAEGVLGWIRGGNSAARVQQWLHLPLLYLGLPSPWLGKKRSSTAALFTDFGRPSGLEEWISSHDGSRHLSEHFAVGIRVVSTQGGEWPPPLRQEPQGVSSPGSEGSVPRRCAWGAEFWVSGRTRQEERMGAPRASGHFDSRI